MNQSTSKQPNRGQFTVLRQICQLIPPYLVPKVARETGVDEKSRTYSSWSHVVTMLSAQISLALSLNDVCDALRLRVGSPFMVRAARPPAKNTLNHANKVRDCAMAEKLFWAMLSHLPSLCPSYVRGGGNRGVTWRFRHAIHAVDSTTIQLVASCMSCHRDVPFGKSPLKANRARLLTEHLLDLADLLLGVALDLIAIAFGFQSGVSDRFAGPFLDLARKSFRGAFDFILGPRFHIDWLFFLHRSSV